MLRRQCNAVAKLAGRRYASYQPTPVEVDKIPKQLFINNEWVDAQSKATFETLNPATEEVICRVAEAGAADVDLAVAAANNAFYGEWGATSSYNRSRMLFKLADLCEQHQSLLSAVETVDNGKPVQVAYAADLSLVIQCLRYYGGWADKLSGKTLELGGPFIDPSAITAYTRHEPVGVVGQIIPWNFPLLMMAWKLGPALATGCSVVLKTAEQTPLSANIMALLIKEAGFPAGTVNVLSGFGDVTQSGETGPGAAIVAHPDVDKVAFTGSTEVGKHIMRKAADTMKRVTLELGGKSPNIVFPDADLDAAVEASHAGLFLNQGQCCCAGSRLFVHEKIYDEFVAKSVARAKSIKVGDPNADDTAQGPQVSREQMDKVLGYIESGKKQGATLLTGGARHTDSGYFVEPTVFADCTEDMTIWNEEIFGPVMAIRKFSNIEDVVREANNTHYGLAAAVFSKDVGTIEYMVKKLRAGTVWVNCYDVFDASAAFGGFKASGIGRELGEYALRNYTEVKQVTMSSKSIYA